jgi:membrane protein DedA with SNARE-associated domain
MNGLRHDLFFLFIHLGGLGQLILGILDSSFLVMPLGNDLLMVVLSVRKHQWMLYYAAMATIGSVLGCLLIDLTVRKHGEEGLEKFARGKRLDYVKRKVSKNAGWALIAASIMPPPFPFTPFVAGAAGLQYPRKKLLTVIGVARMVRFTAIGWLSILFGSRILEWAQSSYVQDAVIAVIVICVVGSVVSVVGWIKRGKRVPQHV